MSTAKILALVSQEKDSSYKTSLREEVLAFTKELAKRARVDPPLPPNTDLTDDEDKELRNQLNDLQALPPKYRQITWLAFTASHLPPLVSAFLKLSPTNQPKAFNTSLQILSLVPDDGPERYFRQFLHSPQARGLPNAVARAFNKGIEYRGPSGLENIGKLILQLTTWCDQTMGDDGRSPFDASVRREFTERFDYLKKNDPIVGEYCKQHPCALSSANMFLMLAECVSRSGIIVASALPPAQEVHRTNDGFDCRPGECKGKPVMRCMGCKSVRYCSDACQKIGWKRGHKYRCFEPSYEVSMDEVLFLK